MDFTYSRRDLADLLGFPSGPFVFTTRQEDLIDDIDLDDFWGSITGESNPNSNEMHLQKIHNPAIRYFHKILAHTLFGKEENNTLLSRDELFILLCVDQGRHVNIVTFRMERFVHLAKNNRTPIIIGGLVTMIADAI
jgi:hypothetical protein